MRLQVLISLYACRLFPAYNNMDNKCNVWGKVFTELHIGDLTALHCRAQENKDLWEKVVEITNNEESLDVILFVLQINSLAYTVQWCGDYGLITDDQADMAKDFVFSEYLVKLAGCFDGHDKRDIAIIERAYDNWVVHKSITV